MRTVDNRRRKAIQASITVEMERVTYSELQRLWSETRKKITRLHRLKKYQMYTPDTYGQFEKRLHDRLIDIIESGLMSMLDLEAAIMAVDAGAFEYLPAEIMRAIEPGLATMITFVSQRTKRAVALRVRRWFETPGENLQSIIDDLKPKFGETRAHLIAQTEITDMNSQMQMSVARTLDIKKWWFQTRRDQSVCTTPIHAPDGNTYKGCRELHGKVFDVDGNMPMPPKGTHPGCRCDGVLIQEPVARKMIKVMRLQKAEFVEAEHPRAADGRFGDKAGTHDARDPVKAHKEGYHEAAKGWLKTWGEANLPDFDVAGVKGSVDRIFEHDKEAGYKKMLEILMKHPSMTPEKKRDLALLSTAIRVGEWRARPKDGKPAGEPKAPKMLAGIKKPAPDKPVEPPKIEAPIADMVPEAKTPDVAPVAPDAEKAKKDGIYAGMIDKMAEFVSRDSMEAAKAYKDPEDGYKFALDLARRNLSLFGTEEEKHALEALHTRLRIAAGRELKGYGAKKPELPKVDPEEVKRVTNEHYAEGWRNLARSLEIGGVPRAETRTAFEIAREEPDKVKAYTDYTEAVRDIIPDLGISNDRKVALITMIDSDTVSMADGLKDKIDAIKPPPKMVAVRRSSSMVAGHGPIELEKLPPLSHWDTALIEEAPHPLYVASKKQKEIVTGRVQSRIRAYASKYGMKPEVVEDKARTYLRTILEDKPVSMRIHLEDLKKVISSDGRFKSQFETGRSHGALNPKYRSEAEHLGLGFPDSVTENKRLRPVYAYISGAGEEASQYGEIELVFKSSVRNRTTVTVGDSLGIFGSGNAIGTPLIDPDIDCISEYEFESVVKGDFHKANRSYMEAQITGGARIDEVASVKLHTRCFDGRGYPSPEYVSIASLLEGKGIKVTHDAHIG